MSVLHVDGRDIEVSNLDKVFFPDDGITKGDVVAYYRRIADRMLRHVRGRPLVMHRFPDGIGGEGFFAKQAPRYFPGWITTAELPKQDGTVRYVVADSAAALVYLADQAALVLHVLLAPAAHPQRCSELIIDLDPPDGNGDAARQVAFAARAVHRLLGELGANGYPKSTGSRGIHVHIPLDGPVGFDRAREVARAMGDLLVSRHPDQLTVAQRIDRRGGRLFLDTLRNAYGQHAVAPYSLRALPGAPVAIPLDWDEATDAAFDPRRITLANIFRRLGHKDDPWAGMPQAGASLSGLRDALADC